MGICHLSLTFVGRCWHAGRGFSCVRKCWQKLISSYTFSTLYCFYICFFLAFVFWGPVCFNSCSISDLKWQWVPYERPKMKRKKALSPFALHLCHDTGNVRMKEFTPAEEHCFAKVCRNSINSNLTGSGSMAIENYCCMRYCVKDSQRYWPLHRACHS